MHGWMIVSSRRSKLAIALLVFTGALANCGPKIEANGQPGNRMPETTIAEVLKQNTDSLMSLPGVVGTAIGECGGNPCIIVMVVKKNPDLMKKIPSALQGFPVIVEETGVIRPLEEKKTK
jgi:hypothetical protein